MHCSVANLATAAGLSITLPSAFEAGCGKDRLPLKGNMSKTLWPSVWARSIVTLLCSIQEERREFPTDSMDDRLILRDGHHKDTVADVEAGKPLSGQIAQ